MGVEHIQIVQEIRQPLRHHQQTGLHLARLVLEAAYEATMWAAVQTAERTGNPTVCLTLLGGGAFGNPSGWIFDAVRRAIDLFAAADLDVVIVSYGASRPAVRALER